MYTTVTNSMAPRFHRNQTRWHCAWLPTRVSASCCLIYSFCSYLLNWHWDIQNTCVVHSNYTSKPSKQNIIVVLIYIYVERERDSWIHLITHLVDICEFRFYFKVLWFKVQKQQVQSFTMLFCICKLLV